MKISAPKKLISLLLAAVMLASVIPFNVISLGADASATDSGDDWYWETYTKPTITPAVSVSGLPENAEAGIEIVDNPISTRKSGSDLGDFLDFYDIKATDKSTGKEIHPTGEFEVTLTARIKDNQNVYLIHVLDDEDVIKNAEHVKLITDSAFVSAFPVASAAAAKALGVKGAVAVEYIDDVTVEGNVITFKTSSFSIYIIGEGNKRLVYKFINGNDVVSEQYVREGDELYDPGLSSDTYTASYGKKFKGWSKNVNGLDNLITIDQLNAELASVNWSTVTDLQTVEIYAQFKNAYFLRYMVMDENNETTVKKTVMVEEDAADKSVTLSYVPTELESNQLFQGWVDATNGNQYPKNTVITVDHHIDLYAKIVGQYWLVFDANAGGPGSGVEYTPPQLLIGTATTVDPTPNNDLERSGYTFLGWYTEPEGGSRFTFGNTINQDITLYAHWQAKNTPYHVVIWKQLATDEVDLPNSEKHYEFFESIERFALTDSTVGTTSGGTSSDTGRNFTGFTYNSSASDTSATVKADGSTVLNVYYDRNVYTLTFKLNGNNTHYIYTPTTSNNGTQYGYYNNSYVQLYYNNGTWYRTRTGRQGNYQYSNPYNGTRYTRSSTNVIKTIRALYEHEVIDNFPIVGDNGVTYTSQRWTPNDDPVWKQTMTEVFLMPARNVTFTRNTDNVNYIQTINYYFEALEGENPTLQYGDKGYVLYSTSKPNYNFVAEESFLEFEGMTKNVALNAQNSEIEPDGNGRYTTLYTSSTVNFLYTRNNYELVFISRSDGGHTVNVPFQKDLNGYGQESDGTWYYEPNNGPDGYFFDGWYQDESCTVPFDFNTTMPSHNITLYAKWSTYRVRAVLVPTENNAHNDEVHFENNQALAFRLNYNEKISDANINQSVAKRTGYKLIGWYTSPTFEDETLWNFNTQVNGNVSGVNMDYQNTSDWINNVYRDNDGAHNNVKGILKLYAKWELDFDENKVYVEYEVEEQYKKYNSMGDSVTNVPFDDTDYELLPGGGSIDITTLEAPSNYAFGFKFDNYVLLNADGTESAITVSPTTSIQVPQSYIEERTISDGTTTGTIKVIRFRAKFSVNNNAATTVTFNGNGGTTTDGAHSATKSVSVLVNENFDMPTASEFSREGYTLVGWAFESDVTPVNFAQKVSEGLAFTPGQTVAADNKTIQGTVNTDANTVYAVWQIHKYSVDLTKVLVNKGVDDSTWNNYDFTVKYTITYPGDYQPVTGDAASNLTGVSLRNGQTYTIQNIPHGSVLTVWEDDIPVVFDCEVSYTGTLATSVTADEDGAKAGTVTITNTRKLIKVYVEKFVDSMVVADQTAPFTFTLNGESKTINAQHIGSEFIGANYFEVPKGSSVTIVESGNDGYDTTYEVYGTNTTGEGSTAALGALSEDTTVVFTNTRPYVTLEIVKEVDVAPSGASFKFIVTINGEQREVVVSASDTTPWTWSLDVPYGSTVSVSEDSSYLFDGTHSVSDYYNYDATAVNGDVLLADQSYTFTNTRKTATLTVTKVVESSYAKDVRTYEFEYTVNGGAVKTFSITPSDNGTEISGTYTLTDTLYAGDVVNITELDKDGNVTTTGEGEKTLTGGSNTVTITNKRESKPLKVTKEVISDYAPDFASGKVYSFSYKIDDGVDTTNGTFTVTMTGNKTETVTIQKDGADILFPVGSTVTVTETAGGDDALVPQNNGQAEIQISGTGTNEVTITNKRESKPLSVTKKVVSNYAPDKNKTYKFSYVADYGPSGTFEIAMGGADSKTVTIQKDGADVLFPIGSNVTVTETEGFDDYLTNDGPKSALIVSVGNSVTITNTRPDVDLTVSKTITNAIDLDDGKTFDFTVKVGDETTLRTIDDVPVGGSKSIPVPKGITVTVSEVTTGVVETFGNQDYNFEDIYVTPVANQDVTMTEAKTVSFTNTRKTVKIYVQKDVADTVHPDDLDYRFQFTVNGTVVTKDGENGIKATETSDAIEVPIGSSVTVVETDRNGTYRTDWAVYGYEETQASQSAQGNTTAAIGRRYGQTTVKFTNNRQKVTLTVKKDVDLDVDKDTKFRFDIDINGTVSHLDISENSPWTSTAVPYGSLVTVSEDLTFKFDGTHATSEYFTADSGNPTVNGDRLTADNTTYTFKNHHKTGTLKVTKQVVSDYAPDYKNGKVYSFTYKIGSGSEVPFSITMKGNKTETVEITGATFYVGDVIDIMEGDLNDSSIVTTYSPANHIVVIQEGTVNKLTVTNTRVTGDLTITKTVNNATANEKFIFKIEKTGQDGTVDTTFKPIYVTLLGNKSVTVKNLVVGSYKVTEVTDWSWRYDCSDPQSKSTEVQVTGGQAAQAEFTNSRNSKNWLYGENSIDNKFTGVTATVSEATTK